MSNISGRSDEEKYIWSVSTILGTCGSGDGLGSDLIWDALGTVGSLTGITLGSVGASLDMERVIVGDGGGLREVGVGRGWLEARMGGTSVNLTRWL